MSWMWSQFQVSLFNFKLKYVVTHLSVCLQTLFWELKSYKTFAHALSCFLQQANLNDLIMRYWYEEQKDRCLSTWRGKTFSKTLSHMYPHLCWCETLLPSHGCCLAFWKREIFMFKLSNQNCQFLRKCSQKVPNIEDSKGLETIRLVQRQRLEWPTSRLRAN